MESQLGLHIDCALWLLVLKMLSKSIKCLSPENSSEENHLLAFWVSGSSWALFVANWTGSPPFSVVNLRCTAQTKSKRFTGLVKALEEKNTMPRWTLPKDGVVLILLHFATNSTIHTLTTIIYIACLKSGIQLITAFTRRPRGLFYYGRLKSPFRIIWSYIPSKMRWGAYVGTRARRRPPVASGALWCAKTPRWAC